ncbi:DUF4097 family beta strand repeat-containing protein [Piscibacillus halophilus]|uniref:DUF4097 and DUF4098 domain-containing protein YvlB n=1 Tax=Piscibacillus halophilus TaxID=571933 RepID=A0A1H9EFG2_9BACI|nr:DUF4097 family beta strand repeat-containing protein [Piscibacillus halophilus]SEQ24297.1 DUF4097 and DUF4098 domain-containing protein YvlB [Piscibacillus halophilus]
MNEQRNKVLKLLEEGHITSEEAEKLLDALDQDQDQHKKQSETDYEENKDSFKGIKKDLKSFTDGIINFIDDTIQRVKEGPFEFTFNHVNVKRQYDYSADGINQFNFDLTNSSVEFIISTSNEVKVEMNGKVYKEDDQSRAEETFDDTFSIGVTNDTLHIDQKQKNVSAEIIIYLPEKKYEQAYIKTINGGVKSRQLNINIARITSINGSIRLDQYEGDSVYVETKHGSIRLDNAELSQAKLETTTGSVYYDGHIEHLDIDVTTGSLRTYLRNLDIKRVDLNTTTGSTQLYLPKNIKVKGHANTSVGSIDVNLPDVVVEKMDERMVKKTVQFYNATEDDPYLDVDIETKTGSIKVNTVN